MATQTISDYDTINKKATTAVDYSRALRIAAGWIEDDGKGVSQASRNADDDAWVLELI